MSISYPEKYTELEAKQALEFGFQVLEYIRHNSQAKIVIHDESIAELHDEIDNLKRDHRLQLRKIKSKIDDEVDKRVEEELKEHANMTSQLNSIQESLESITELYNHDNSPATKGELGESHIEQLLINQFTTADIQNISEQKASCDLHLSMNGKKIIFEIKNKAKISPSDLKKFERDVKIANESIAGAIFVSIRTKNIPGHGEFAMTTIDNIPVIYMYVGPAERLYIGVNALLMMNQIDSSESDSEIQPKLFEQLSANLSSATKLTNDISKLERQLTIMENIRLSMYDNVKNMHRKTYQLLSDVNYVEDDDCDVGWNQTHIAMLRSAGLKKTQLTRASVSNALGISLDELKKIGTLKNLKDIW